MKSRLSHTPLFERLRYNCDRMYRDCVARKNDFVAVKACVRRQHQVLLGIGIFFLMCWIIASIWLINMQREERVSEEVLERQATISMQCPKEMVTNREMVSGVFTSIDISVAGEI